MLARRSAAKPFGSRTRSEPEPSIAPGISRPASRPLSDASTWPDGVNVARTVAPETLIGPRFSLKPRSTSIQDEPRPDRLPSTSNSESRPLTFHAPGSSTSIVARSNSRPTMLRPLLLGSTLIRAFRMRMRIGWFGFIDTCRAPMSTFVTRTATE